MQNTAKVLTNIVPITEITVTEGTLSWVETLYEAGAIQFGPEGQMEINPEVREVIHAMHAVLAGGKVNIEIEHDGGNKCVGMERSFDRAMDEAIAANVHRDPSDKRNVPLGP